MIAEIGLALLWLAAACAALQVVAGLVPRAGISNLGGPAALAQGWLWLWIIGCLCWVFAQGDMSVAAVAANTHSALPMGLRYAAIVLRDGGGLLLATALVALGGGVLALTHRPPVRWLGAIGAVAMLLHVALFVAALPFARLVPAPTEGAGFDSGWRDRIDRLAPIGSVVFGGALLPGATSGEVRFAGLVPAAGPDWTAIEATIEVGSPATILKPQWRTTNRPQHSASVSDLKLGPGGWYSAEIGAPRADGRWPIIMRQVALTPFLLLGSGILAGLYALARRRWW